MTVIMYDATAELGAPAAHANKHGTLYDLLYADDTLIIGAAAHHVTELASAVERIGANYGMTLHWGRRLCPSVQKNASCHQKV
jgi:hypothetical protein